MRKLTLFLLIALLACMDEDKLSDSTEVETNIPTPKANGPGEPGDLKIESPPAPEGSPVPAEPESPTGAAQAPSGLDARFAYDSPDGWQELPPTSLRNPNFTIGDNPDAQVYVTVLQGGGGIEANINRWLGQMNHSELASEEIQALPHITFFDMDAPLLDVSGTYSGGTMQGSDQSRPGYRLVATAAEVGGELMSVKMIGPADALADQMGPFQYFIRSLRFGESSDDTGRTP